MTNSPLDCNDISERIMLPAVHRLLGRSDCLWRAASGATLQILGPGITNVHEGPDFLDMALMIGGRVITGDGEFHKKIQYWHAHGHDSDERYKRVALHIVCGPEYDVAPGRFETLFIDPALIAGAMADKPSSSAPADYKSIVDLQDYAMMRLGRKSETAWLRVRRHGVQGALGITLREFITGYLGRRRRPVHMHDGLRYLYEYQDAGSMPYLPFLESIDMALAATGAGIEPFELTGGRHLPGIGAHLEQEILVNCVLPLALAIACAKAGTDLLILYWSLRSLNIYGGLARRFEGIPQEYVWQQQGMLEYLARCIPGRHIRDL